MNRRDFLKGLAGILAVGAAPAVLPSGIIMPIRKLVVATPVLWGDGLHDDTAAIQKMIDEAATSSVGIVNLKTGNYLISSPLISPDHVAIFGNGSTLKNLHYPTTVFENFSFGFVPTPLPR